jgi:hypothetical protein
VEPVGKQVGKRLDDRIERLEGQERRSRAGARVGSRSRTKIQRARHEGVRASLSTEEEPATADAGG